MLWGLSVTMKSLAALQVLMRNSYNCGMLKNIRKTWGGEILQLNYVVVKLCEFFYSLLDHVLRGNKARL